MSIPVLMPALSPTMTEGKLAKWHVKVGDAVKAGQVICEIETDKATMEVEAVDEGTVAQILVEEGTEGVAVNTPICILAAEGESVGRRREGGARRRARRGRKPRPPRPRRPATEKATPKAAAPAQLLPRRRRAAEPEWTGKTDHMTVREALRDAMAEEMRTRRAGLPDGRGGRAVPGRLQGEPGPAGGVRRQASDRHADHRARLHRPGRRRGVRRAEADRRVHDLQLRHAGDGPDHQLGGQDALHVGRADDLPDRVPRPQRRGGARRRPAFAVLRELVRARARACACWRRGARPTPRAC